MKTSPFLSQTQPWYNLTMLVKLKTLLLTPTLGVWLPGLIKTEQCVSQYKKDNHSTEMYEFLRESSRNQIIPGILSDTLKLCSEHKDMCEAYYSTTSCVCELIPMLIPGKFRQACLTDQRRQQVTHKLQRQAIYSSWYRIIPPCW